MEADQKKKRVGSMSGRGNARSRGKKAETAEPLWEATRSSESEAKSSHWGWKAGEEVRPDARGGRSEAASA